MQTVKHKPRSHSRRRRTARRLIFTPVLLGIVAAGIVLAVRYAPQAMPTPQEQAKQRVEHLEQATIPERVQVNYIDNENARSGERLADFTGVVIHYVGNPATTAAGNRNYFNQPTTEVVSHFIIGLDGEIIQCLPLHERSAASNERNRDTISIEVCHPDESGKFNDATYESLVWLTAWLCDLGELDESAVIRHYDVTGKECPLYYVQNPAAWERLRADVANAQK
jgi:N-acetyl-anhydromuramyl-L-alanine amidase AmpD